MDGLQRVGQGADLGGEHVAGRAVACCGRCVVGVDLDEELVERLDGVLDLVCRVMFWCQPLLP